MDESIVKIIGYLVLGIASGFASLNRIIYAFNNETWSYLLWAWVFISISIGSFIMIKKVYTEMREK